MGVVVKSYVYRYPRNNILLLLFLILLLLETIILDGAKRILGCSSKTYNEPVRGL